MYPISISRQATKPITIPGPVGGINALDSIMGMPPQDCISSINLIPRTYGCEVRKGYREHANTFTGISNGVRTVIPFEGSVVAQDRLFAGTLEGIYNVSAEGAPGAVVQAWASKTGSAGYCTYAVYTTIADKFLFVADEQNGLYRYTQSTGLWTAPGALGITGVVPADVVHVSVFKQRLWFTQKDSGIAWYLEPGLIAGAAVSFQFGNKFLSGGFLNSLHNLTLDAGVGPDDYLVAISSSGDVVAYQGINPATMATFEIVGAWNVGHLPKGRRLVSSAGGDLYLLCAYGILSLTQLIKGTDPGTLPAYITGKITPLVRDNLAAVSSSDGWSLISHPTEGLLILTVPDGGTDYTSYRQYAMNTSTRAWTKLLGLPIHCGALWNGTLYMGCPSPAGDTTGRVYTYRGSRDNVRLSDPGTTGDPINGFMLTVYQGEGVNTRVHFIKPQFMSSASPLYEVSARYDFDIDDFVATLAGVLPASTGTTWSSMWSAALWGGSNLVPFSELRGATGLGRYAALTLTTRTKHATTLAGFTAMFDSGGLL